MFKLLRNKKGQTGLEIPAMAYVVIGIMGLITTIGLGKTALNGVLVNNAKVITCKAANNGEQFCNEKYGYTPKAVEVEVAGGGGLRARILAAQK